LKHGDDDCSIDVEKKKIPDMMMISFADWSVAAALGGWRQGRLFVS